MELGPILFENPYALAALALLPVIWWLLRFTPPRPDRIAFPPIRLLLGLTDQDETPHKSPWWLTVLRIVIAAAVIVALADPLYNPDRHVRTASGPLLVVVDDGWAAAPGWKLRADTLDSIVSAAERAARPVALALTTPRSTPPTLAYLAPNDVRRRIGGLVPQALAPDRMALADEIARQLADPRPAEIVWLSDGIDYGSADQFVAGLADLAAAGAPVRVISEGRSDSPLVLDRPESGDGGLAVRVRRADPAVIPTGSVRALALNGRPLGDARFDFAEGETETSARFDIPLALRNQIGRLEIIAERSAGGVFLLDDRWRRRPVGMVSGTSRELAQPLLSPLHYVARALEPFAEITQAPSSAQSSGVAPLLDQGQSVLMVADIGQFAPEDEARVAEWVDDGGILVRFAGPKLAANNDDLIPVRLRRGGRALGGALSWSQPQKLAPFDDDSPFDGLETLSADVTVSRQVLAEPSTDLARKSWARLDDGTPLVTAEPRGNGMLVLFHVPASPDWSNLPLSGVFVQMLRRIVDLSAAAVGATTEGAVRVGGTASAALPPLSVLNGFGELVAPAADVVPVAGNADASLAPTPRNPPGLYGRDNRMRAINTVGPDTALSPLHDSGVGSQLAGYQSAPATVLKGPLLATAFVLLLLDTLAVLFLSGRLSGRGLSRSAAAIGVLVLVGLPGAMPEASAQATAAEDEFALRAALETRLAYVVTGTAQVDDISLAGLTGLSGVLGQRTALEPGAPMGVDVERDELAFFPLIYWPVLPEAAQPSDRALAKIDAYMKNGGTILFDTRDQQQALPGLTQDEVGAGTAALRRIIANLDIPPLQVVPDDHVITKAFYLLQSFPGRWTGGQLWVQADGGEDRQPGTTNYDGVSAIIIGSNDFAGAWAVDNNDKPLLPVVPGGPRQREMAFRTGVNIVMYALTGNYKADQVHVPALLERLGQ